MNYKVTAQQKSIHQFNNIIMSRINLKVSEELKILHHHQLSIFGKDSEATHGLNKVSLVLPPSVQLLPANDLTALSSGADQTNWFKYIFSKILELAQLIKVHTLLSQIYHDYMKSQISFKNIFRSLHSWRFPFLLLS